MEATNPLFALLRQLNAADIVFIIIVFRILYIAFENGFVVECFKLTGIVLATYIGLHYYSRLAVFSRDFLSLGKETSMEVLSSSCLIILLVVSYLASVFFRALFSKFIKLEAVPILQKWGGLLLGGARGILAASLVAIILSLSAGTYLNDKVYSSYFGKRLLTVAPAVYASIWNGFMSRLTSQERSNKFPSKIHKSKTQ